MASFWQWWIPALFILRTVAAPAGSVHTPFLATGVPEPNPPTFPSNVYVFGPGSDTEVQRVVDYVYSLQGGQEFETVDHQFVTGRYALLFKPGTYDVAVPVGFYTSVFGLGASPYDVQFTSDRGVYSVEAATKFTVGALQNFWREAANFRTSASATWNGKQGMLWATSQGTSLRNVVVDRNLMLYQYDSVDGQTLSGFASGGFVGNVNVSGEVRSGSQQQYLTRNSAIGKGWTQAVWNMVFVGTAGAPASHCSDVGGLPMVTAATTPIIAEKPSIRVAADKFYLRIPAARADRQGVDHGDGTTPEVDFASVYVAVAGRDTADSINAKLNTGLHVVLTPGIYVLDEPIVLTMAGQVLLGIGSPTLVASAGQPAVVVADVDGARVAGLILEAGENPSPTLLQVGVSRRQGNATDPVVLSDIAVRVCGPSKKGQAKTMVVINSGGVIGDNLWLWRADHTLEGPVMLGECPVETGLVVNGDDVTMYGLACEHTTKDCVQWNGERGRTFFYQSEMPYDVNEDYSSAGYVSYRVGSSVKAHEAHGVGVYHYFRDYNVTVPTCISAPPQLEASFESPLAVFLNGKGVALHILNDKGPSTARTGPGATPQWICHNTTARAPASEERVSVMI